MKSAFKIGDLNVEPGKIGKGWIPLAKTYDGELRMPVIVANGTGEGKTLLLCTGIHGTEYVGLDAILRLVDQLDPTRLKGQLLCLPFVNIPAFEAITRGGAYDLMDLNRIFPGKKDGFMSQKIAYLLVNDIFPRVDYAIDLHCGQMNDLQTNICGFFLSEKDDTSLKMAKAFGIQILWNLSSSGLKGTFSDTATEKGIPSIIIEVGGEGRCLEEWVQLEIRGFRNVMKALGMIEGQPEGLPSKYELREGFYMSGNAGGLLRPVVKLEDSVEEGQLLGTIIDLHGNVLEEVLSPMKGKVLGMRTLPRIRPGDWTFWLAKLVREIS